jgi:hypothetical protein
MKKKPFIEIINWKKEIKEYKHVCMGRSNEFTYYSEWKEHIISLLDKIKNENDMENFKHFCRNRERSTRSSPTLYFELMVVFITVYIGNVLDKPNPFLLISMFVIAMFFIMLPHKAYEKEHYFYIDILEIIEEKEKTNSKITPQ